MSKISIIRIEFLLLFTPGICTQYLSVLAQNPSLNLIYTLFNTYLEHGISLF